MYKNVFFDLDGTLLYTLPDIVSVLNFTLARFKLPKVSETQAMAYVGDGAFKLVQRAANTADDALLQAVYADYMKNFALCDNSLSAYYAGEEEALSHLSGCGVRFAIVTNKPQRATQNVYEKYFSRYDFFSVQGQTEGGPLKPSPEGVLKAVSENGLKLEECLFVGDGETDVLTAKNAGMDCVSVLWGYRSRGQLVKAGASRFASSFKELADIVLSR